MAMFKAKPTPQQLAWADMEIGVLIHYGMEIYNPEFKAPKTKAVRTELSPDRINPTKLDTDQWVAAASSLGAKYAVLVANHITGFSLWPTEVNDYSVASLKWKDGKGDIVADFVKSCEKYGLKPGLYYSTCCNGYYNINDEWKWDYQSPYYQEYVRNVEKQVTELWTKYGKLFEIWFDGGIVPLEKGGPNLVPILKKYQPDAICYQGPREYPHDIRWVGNENGLAPENCWSTTNNGEAGVAGVELDLDALGNGDPNGKYWWPAETDMPNRMNHAFGGGWAWKAGEEDKVFSPEHLLDCYVRSVGRNSNLLLGMAISTDGDFKDEEQFRKTGELIRNTFGKNIGETSGMGKTFRITLPEATEIRYISIMEDISDGQNIRGYEILLDGEKFYSSKCIGHKRILKAEGRKAKEIVLNITSCVDLPTVRRFEIF